MSLASDFFGGSGIDQEWQYIKEADGAGGVYPAVDGDALMVSVLDDALQQDAVAGVIAWDAAVDIFIDGGAGTIESVTNPAGTVASTQAIPLVTTQPQEFVMANQIINSAYMYFGLAYSVQAAIPVDQLDIHFCIRVFTTTAQVFVDGVQVETFSHTAGDEYRIVVDGDQVSFYKGTMKFYVTTRTTEVRPAWAAGSGSSTSDIGEANLVEVLPVRGSFSVGLPATTLGRVQNVRVADFLHDCQGYPITVNGGVNNIIDNPKFLLDIDGIDSEFISPKGSTDWGVVLHDQ